MLHFDSQRVSSFAPELIIKTQLKHIQNGI